MIKKSCLFWDGEHTLFSRVKGLAMIDAAAAGVDSEKEAVRRGHIENVTGRLIDQGLLQKGVTRRHAEDVLFLLTSFEVFDFFVPAPFSLTETTWATQYPFGHPMMLAFGEVFGAPWLIPPLLAAASAALIFVVGRQVYNQRVAIIAAVLLATSPFFIMNASNFMSHNTAGFFLLASLAALTAGLSGRCYSGRSRDWRLACC